MTKTPKEIKEKRFLLLPILEDSVHSCLARLVVISTCWGGESRQRLVGLGEDTVKELLPTSHFLHPS